MTAVKVWICDEGDLIGPFRGELVECDECHELEHVLITDDRWKTEGLDIEEGPWPADLVPDEPAYLVGDTFYWEPADGEWPAIHPRKHTSPQPQPQEPKVLRGERSGRP